MLIAGHSQSRLSSFSSNQSETPISQQHMATTRNASAAGNNNATRSGRGRRRPSHAMSGGPLTADEEVHRLPYKMQCLLDQPELPADHPDQLANLWDPRACSQHIDIVPPSDVAAMSSGIHPSQSTGSVAPQRGASVLHRAPVAQSTDAVRTRTPLSRGQHLWRLDWDPRERGTHAVVGVVTAQAPLQGHGYFSLVGSNPHSWGWDLTSRRALHDCTPSTPANAATTATTATSPTASMEPHGARASEVLESMETDDDEEIIISSSSSAIASERSPATSEDAHSASETCARQCRCYPAPEDTPLVSSGGSMASGASGVVGSSDPGTQAPDQTEPNQSQLPLPASIYVLLDMEAGTLAFIAGGRYLGVAHDRLAGKQLFLAVSAVWGHCRVALRYLACLPGSEPLSLAQQCRQAVREQLPGAPHLWVKEIGADLGECDYKEQWLSNLLPPQCLPVDCNEKKNTDKRDLSVTEDITRSSSSKKDERRPSSAYLPLPLVRYLAHSPDVS